MGTGLITALMLWTCAQSGTPVLGRFGSGRVHTWEVSPVAAVAAGEPGVSPGLGLRVGGALTSCGGDLELSLGLEASASVHRESWVGASGAALWAVRETSSHRTLVGPLAGYLVHGRGDLPPDEGPKLGLTLARHTHLGGGRSWFWRADAALLLLETPGPALGMALGLAL